MKKLKEKNMSKKKCRKYSPEFKLSVILDMWENHLSYRETTRKYWKTKSRQEEDAYRRNIKFWMRTYLLEGEEGLMRSHGKHKKSNPQTKDEILAENERLKRQLYLAEIELEYLKKLDALIRAEEQKNKKKQK